MLEKPEGLLPPFGRRGSRHITFPDTTAPPLPCLEGSRERKITSPLAQYNLCVRTGPVFFLLRGDVP